MWYSILITHSVIWILYICKREERERERESIFKRTKKRHHGNKKKKRYRRFRRSCAREFSSEPMLFSHVNLKIKTYTCTNRSEVLGRYIYILGNCLVLWLLLCYCLSGDRMLVRILENDIVNLFWFWIDLIFLNKRFHLSFFVTINLYVSGFHCHCNASAQKRSAIYTTFRNGFSQNGIFWCLRALSPEFWI